MPKKVMERFEAQHIAEPQNHEIFITESVVAEPESLFASQDELIYFYNGHDCAQMKTADLLKTRELQDTNDKIQKQIFQLDREIKQSNDSLTLIAEKERLLILIARNTGEILKIHTENQERLQRIMEIESENVLLNEDMINQRNKFVDSHEISNRSKFAADFFLAKSKIERNNLELIDLIQE